MEKDAAGHTLKLAESRDLERKALVGNQCAMRREHLLPVATLLQGAEYLFKVRLHAPLVRRDELREAHCLKVHESCGKVFLELLGGFRQRRVIWIGSHRKVGRGAVVAALQDAVERCVAVLKRFAALRLLGIRRGAIAQGFGSNFFGPLAQARSECIPLASEAAFLRRPLLEQRCERGDARCCDGRRRPIRVACPGRVPSVASTRECAAGGSSGQQTQEIR